MSKRLVKVAKDLNQSVKELAEIFNKMGFVVIPKPTTMISDEMERQLYKELKKDVSFHSLDKSPKLLLDVEDPILILKKADDDVSHSNKEEVKQEGSYPLSEVAEKLQTNDDVIIKILLQNDESLLPTVNSILSPEQVSYVIDYYLRNEKQFSLKRFEQTTFHKPSERRKGKNLPKLTSKTIRKIRKKKEKERLEKEEKRKPFLTNFFKSMQTRNPRIDRNFGPGGIWPVKKK